MSNKKRLGLGAGDAERDRTGLVAAASNGRAPSAQQDVLEEIVVTGLKRGDLQVQSVPVSVAIMDSDRLEKLGAVEFADFARSVSGLTFVDSGAGNKRYVIRGINSGG